MGSVGSLRMDYYFYGGINALFIIDVSWTGQTVGNRPGELLIFDFASQNQNFRTIRNGHMLQKYWIVLP